MALSVSLYSHRSLTLSHLSVTARQLAKEARLLTKSGRSSGAGSGSKGKKAEPEELPWEDEEEEDDEDDGLEGSSLGDASTAAGAPASSHGQAGPSQDVSSVKQEAAAGGAQTTPPPGDDGPAPQPKVGAESKPAWPSGSDNALMLLLKAAGGEQ